MQASDMQVIGVCRFSYPAIGGFKIEHETTEEREAFLYAPERLEERFRTFESFTLPALQAQSDPDFTFLVVIGQRMPPDAEARLRALLADMPQAVIQARPPERHRTAMFKAIEAVREDRGVPSLQFRMDDDDAVSVRFVERLRAAADRVRPLIRQERFVAFDFNHGHVARPGPEGISAQPVVKPVWTPALGMSVKPWARRGILNFGHQKLPELMPVLTLPDPDMFVRGHNTFNGSRQRPGIKPLDLPLLDSGGEAVFRRAFNIEPDHVRTLWREPLPS
ncbi:putative rhamnosyl transferase [Roseovarius salinarum]|uniref:putative rhamnosyl transferase n=1 Tax=Roseovarius salinarum TaxID=1981892 RepID=UPI001E5A812E|nr:putative rhamnosyl transferase [Roseovarius salinarum]